MSGEMILFLAVFLLAIFGVYKYVSAETNDYKILVNKMEAFEVDLVNQQKLLVDSAEWNSVQDEDIKELKSLIAKWKIKSDGVEKEIDAAQEHMAKLRASQIELRDRSYPRTVEIQLKAPTGPIPIEIYSTAKVLKSNTITRKVLKKTKNGYQTRSETRSAPLTGSINDIKKVKKKTKSKVKVKKTRKRVLLPGLKKSLVALKESRV